MSLKKSKNGEKYPLLSGYPCKSNFIGVEGIQIHYIAEGEIGSPTVLLLHGVPGWSYTYRNIIPICVASGLRVIAPDLPGFGKSDKPLDKNFYYLEKLVTVIESFILKLNLERIFLFSHDWGAIIGMIIAAKNPVLFSGIIACNGFLPMAGQMIPLSFRLWQWFTQYSPYIPVGKIINFATSRGLSKVEQAGYDYPFSNEREKIAIRILPGLIREITKEPGIPAINKCWNELKKFDKPFLTVFSNNDPISRGGEKILQSLIPGTRDQPHMVLKGSHFLQEDAPTELGLIIREFVKRNK